MSTTYDGDPANWPDSITIPSDGDARTASSVNAAFEGLADRTAALLRYGGGLGAQAKNLVPKDLTDIEPSCGLYDPDSGLWLVFGLDGVNDKGWASADGWKWPNPIATLDQTVDVRGCAVATSGAIAGTIVAMGDSNTYYVGAGAAFVGNVLPGSGESITHVVWDDEHDLFIALGLEGGALKIWKSATGLTGSWTAIELAASGQTPLGLLSIPAASASFPGRCIVVDHSSPTSVSVRRSDDVTTFTPATGTQTALTSGLAYSVELERLMYIQADGNVHVSDDGAETFGAASATGVLGGLFGLVVDGILWVALHDASGAVDVAYSSDLGVTWNYSRALQNAGAAVAFLVHSAVDERLMLFAENEVGVGLRAGPGRLA
jgi:hypothetical protein